MTGHCSIDKSVYCSVWSEGQCGRSGYDMASAICRILEAVLKAHPNIKNLILWSDSCVPQNRNKILSTAISSFLQKYPEIQSITQKFSESGHTCIQEIDAEHSSIGSVLKKTELYSPLGVVRMLKSVRHFHPFNILQMKESEFLKQTFTTFQKFLLLI